MGKLFDIVKNEVQLTPEVLAIPALNAIWDRDKNKGKEKAKKEVSYIVFSTDYRSPYKDVPYSEKDMIIIRDLFGKNAKWEPDELIKEGVEKYKELQKSRHMRLLEATFKTEEEVTKYFENVDMTKTDDFGRPLYTMENIMKNMEKVGALIQSMTKLEKQVQAEMAELSARGGTEIGYYENPNSIKNIKVS